MTSPLALQSNVRYLAICILPTVGVIVALLVTKFTNWRGRELRVELSLWHWQRPVPVRPAVSQYQPPVRCLSTEAARSPVAEGDASGMSIHKAGCIKTLCVVLSRGLRLILRKAPRSFAIPEASKAPPQRDRLFFGRSSSHHGAES